MKLDHINEKFREIARLPNENRIQFLNSERWINYPAAKRVIEELDDLLIAPRRTRMRSLLIVGNPSNGKSSILETFVKKHSSELDETLEDEEISVPIIKIETSKPDIKQLYIEILTAFWTPFRPSQTENVLRQQAIHVMRECKLKMLLIDEFHSLLTGTAKQQREVMNEIKYLSNVLKISIVGAGTKEAVNVLHTDPQYASRFDLIQLPIWKFDRPWLQLLFSFEQGLPLKKPSNLIDKEKSQLILSISQGILGNVDSLIRLCAIKAIESGSEEISLSLLKEFKWHTPTRGNRQLKM